MSRRKWRFFEALVRRQGTVRLHTPSRRREQMSKVMALGAAACISFNTRSLRAEDSPASAGITAPTAQSSSTVVVPEVVPAPAAAAPPPSTMPEVVVTGQRGYYKGQPVSSPKYTQPLLDTPQSASVVTQEVMEDRGVTTLRDALRNVAGISLSAGEAGAQGDNLTVRGFSARSDIFRDGMRDFGSYYRDSFNDEQVEVLKGPASVNFGRGSTGGVVNQVSKTPHLEAYNEGTLTFGTDHTKRATADMTAPLPGLGEHTALRLNIMANDSEVVGRTLAENKRFGLAPSLAFGIGTPTRLTLDYFHQSEDDIPDYGLPFLLGRPAPVDWSNSYGFRDHNYLRADADVSTVKAEHDFNDQISVRNQTRYAKYDRDVQITEPQIAGVVTPATPLSAIQVSRVQIAATSTETYLGNQTDGTFKFKTGPVGHTVVSGVEVSQETSDPERVRQTGVPNTSLLNPDTNQEYLATSAPVISRVHTIAKSLGIYILDTLKLTEQWEVTGGLRFDQFNSHYQQTIAPAVAFERVDRMVSKRGSLVYKPLPKGSLYVSYGNSFNPSAESLALAANTAMLNPEETKTYEVGTKWDFLDGGLSITGAIFRDDKTNARTVDPNNPLLNVLTGEQRVEGYELSASGKVTEKWQVFSSYAFMESIVRRSNNPLEQGSPVANAPKHSGNLWTTYTFPRDIQAGVGANAISSRATTATRDAATGILKEVPGYMTFDAMLKAPITGKLSLQLNLYNMLNHHYFDTLHPAHIIPGAGRTLLLTTRIDF